MSLKISLISPIGLKKILGADFFFKLPFLGLPTIAAHTPPGCQVKMVDERISPVDFDTDADLIGISVMTPLATRAYEIADEFKRRGKTVVMGGMHEFPRYDDRGEGQILDARSRGRCTGGRRRDHGHDR